MLPREEWGKAALLGKSVGRVYSGLTNCFCSVFLHVLSSPTWILDYSLLGKNSIYLPSWTESGAGEAGTHLVLTHKDALCDGNLRLQGSGVCVRGRLITWISLFLGSR